MWVSLFLPCINLCYSYEKKIINIEGVFLFIIHSLYNFVLDGLQEASVGPVGLEEGTALFLDSRWKRETDLRVVHLLNTIAAGVFDGLNADDLNRVGPGTMASSHIAIALGDSGTDGQVTVLAVRFGPGVVSEPDSEVFDLQGLALADGLNADDLSGGLLELAELA